MDYSYIMIGSTNTEYSTSGKYLSEKKPMIHQRRIIESFVLIYGVSGTLYISDGGREYAVSPNDYLILAANREHLGTRPSPAGISYYWCHFYIRGEYLLSGDSIEWLTFGDRGEYSVPTYGHFKNSSKMHLLFHQLIDSSRTASRFSSAICQSFLDIIFAELAVEATEEKASGHREATVANIVEWIRINAAELNSVEDVASYFGYNSEYLSTMMRQVTGRGTVDHINESRIALARELLRTGEDKLSVVAERCGFNDEKYFSRVFKKMCDVSPGAFRNAYRKKHINDK